ncbi:hypothetical protein K1719_007568 [Acacia pycnantha]|nr:hypothetical protein K1719_007568 [Acacia pycnantha]
MCSAENRSFIPLSRVEDDLIRRSSKKIKNTGKGVGVPQGDWPKLGAKSSEFSQGGSSFADKLKGQNGDGDSSDEDNVKEGVGYSEDVMSEDDTEPDDSAPLCVTEEDPIRNFPTFIFSDRMKRRLYRAWRKSVIVKLLDKSIGYKALLTRLQTMWAKKGVIRLIDIGYGFYVVKLSNRDDYKATLTGGPWMIYDHYLTSKKQGTGEDKLPEEGNGQSQQRDKVSAKDPFSHRDQWRTVQKPRRVRKTKEVQEGPLRQGVQGSRFGVLIDTEGQTVKEPTNDVVQGCQVQELIVPPPLLRSRPVRDQRMSKEGNGALKAGVSDIQVVPKAKENVGAHEKRKRVEPRARDGKGGELLMLTYGDRIGSQPGPKAQLEENLITDRNVTLGGIVREEVGATGDRQDLLDPGEMDVAQMDLLDPGVDGDVVMGPSDPPLGPDTSSRPTDGSQDGNWAEVSLVPETQLSNQCQVLPKPGCNG